MKSMLKKGYTVKKSIVMLSETKTRFDYVKSLMSSKKRRIITSDEAVNELCDSWLGIMEEA